MDVEAYLKHEDRLILVLGAIEQHGYLSLATDVKIPQALADAAGLKAGVLVAPALNYGVSPYFTAYPGTFTLRLSTFLDTVEDLVRSAYRQGFRRILVLNGHGGNDPARGRLVEVANELPGLKLGWYAWWLAHSVEEIAIRHNLRCYHAAWMEAFPFCQVAELPTRDQESTRREGPFERGRDARNVRRRGFWRTLPGGRRNHGRNFHGLPSGCALSPGILRVLTNTIEFWINLPNFPLFFRSDTNGFFTFPKITSFTAKIFRNSSAYNP